MGTIKLRDPVHNFIRFDVEEMKLVNLDIIQRLRGIKQLAMASLVYPGALHTRFDHTLGVAHVAGQMAEELSLEPDEQNLVRQAALLHDVGHGPFSHVSEYILERFADRNVLPVGLKKEKIHEIITGHLIKNHKPLRKRLGQERCDQIAMLLSEGVGNPILKSIVSGPLDADKQDYLLRDSLYAGVNYGVFDIHQLQRSLISETLEGQRELVIRADGVHAVEQFVLAKYYLTTMVYRHKVRLISDQMLVRAITLGIEKDENRELTRLYSFRNASSFYDNYIRWHDARFMLKFGDEGKANAKCALLLNKLTRRELLKRVLYAPIKEFPAVIKEKLMAISRPQNSKLRIEIEKEIAKVLATECKTTVSSDFTILNTYQIKSVRESSRNDEASILVSKPTWPVKFEDESVLFASINERFSDEYVEVYAPVIWSDRAERVKRLNRVVPLIKEIITTKIPSLQLSLDL
jgi:HD superfamily phosphohydrolase